MECVWGGGWGGGPCPGNRWVWKPGGDASCGPGLYPQHCQEPGEGSQLKPSDPGRGRSSTKHLNPRTPVRQGGLHGTGDPQEPAWGGSQRPPPPACAASPPIPSTASAHVLRRIRGEVGGEAPYRLSLASGVTAASSLGSGGSGCVTV